MLDLYPVSPVFCVFVSDFVDVKLLSNCFILKAYYAVPWWQTENMYKYVSVQNRIYCDMKPDSWNSGAKRDVHCWAMAQ